MKEVVKLLKNCATTHASKNSNGYYIVSEKWNTCFFFDGGTPKKTK